MPAGDVTDGVVRVGGTIRRPHQPQSFAVAEYLDWLEDAGFDGSPRFLGRDAQGRDVLTFVPGQCAGRRSGGLGRSPRNSWPPWPAWCAALHAASAGFVPRRPSVPAPARSGRIRSAGLVCHLDVTPQNVVVRDGRAAGLVDFDLAGPAHGAPGFAQHRHALGAAPRPADAWPGWEAADPFRRLRIFADAYGWNDEERRRLPGAGIEAAALSYERMQHNARALGGGWARMWQDGAGGHDPPPRRLARGQRRRAGSGAYVRRRQARRRTFRRLTFRRPVPPR